MKRENLNPAYDPEFSEYNPLYSELEDMRVFFKFKEDSFLGNFLRKITTRVMIRLD